MNTLIRRINSLKVSISITIVIGMMTLLGRSSHAVASDLTALQLLNLTRRPPLQECWAILQGVVKYKEKNSSTQTYPIELRALVNADRAHTQLTFAGGERYLIKQHFGDQGKETHILKDTHSSGSKINLQTVGIHPEDLTLSFLYWNYNLELAAQKLRGQSCRLLKLSDSATQDYVIVWIAVDYHFPLRVEWFHIAEVQPYRRLDFLGFKRINEVWILKELRIDRDQGKTMLQFTQAEVNPVSTAMPLPADFFTPFSAK